MRFIRQENFMDCGPSCIAMIASFYKKDLSLSYLRDESQMTREGISLLSVDQTCKKIGFDTMCGQFTIDYLVENFDSPVILHWNSNHFVVLKRIIKKRNNQFFFVVFDPSFGKIKLNQKDFEFSWVIEANSGFGIFLKPNLDFYKFSEPKSSDLHFSKLLSFIKPFKRKFFHVLFLMLIGNALTLTFPFLTKELVDKGVGNKDVNYITQILIAQLILFISITIFDVWRNQIVLYIGSRIGVNIVLSFLKKLFTLPIRYFETRMESDLNQRINDNERIQQFLTNQSLTTIFSAITLFVYLGVFAYFGFVILITYLFLSILSLIWSFSWLKKQKKIDYTIFQLSSKNYESLSEILRGVSEMKLNNFEIYKQNKWEKIQDEWLVIRMKSMKINQIQTVGYELINQVKNIIVIFFAANLVANNELTMGSLLSISFIIGQMNGPISDIIDFNRSFMEAKLSYSRLNEIQVSKPEDNEDHISLPKETETINQGITISNLTFRYEGINSPIVLDNVNFFIPNGKTTAIVGASGSGKTTLLKILLKYYSIEDNRILFNGVDFNKYSARSIRENSGTVMQDGFIFSETLYRNIVMGDEGNEVRFQQSIKIANLTSFINELPLAQNTIIGNSGINISGGQKQRILIARAVYKNAKYFFFDEATSALDSENERIIYNNLKKHFENKTVIVVAHRLSTVKNADQIVVLNDGKVVEIGSHKELILNKSYYHNLVQNQLELGK